MGRFVTSLRITALGILSLGLSLPLYISAQENGVAKEKLSCRADQIHEEIIDAQGAILNEKCVLRSQSTYTCKERLVHLSLPNGNVVTECAENIAGNPDLLKFGDENSALPKEWYETPSLYSADLSHSSAELEEAFKSPVLEYPLDQEAITFPGTNSNVTVERFFDEINGGDTIHTTEANDTTITKQTSNELGELLHHESISPEKYESYTKDANGNRMFFTSENGVQQWQVIDKNDNLLYEEFKTNSGMRIISEGTFNEDGSPLTQNKILYDKDNNVISYEKGTSEYNREGVHIHSYLEDMNATSKKIYEETYDPETGDTTVRQEIHTDKGYIKIQSTDDDLTSFKSYTKDGKLIAEVSQKVNSRGEPELWYSTPTSRPVLIHDAKQMKALIEQPFILDNPSRQIPRK